MHAVAQRRQLVCCVHLRKQPDLAARCASLPPPVVTLQLVLLDDLDAVSHPKFDFVMMLGHKVVLGPHVGHCALQRDARVACLPMSRERSDAEMSGIRHRARGGQAPAESKQNGAE